MDISKGGKEYFNKKYIKDHPYYLFVFEDTLEDEDFEDYSNVFPIPTYDDDGEYFEDKYLHKNKKLIKDAFKDIQKALKRKRFKKVVIPELSIGKGKSRLHKKQPETYEYIKKQMKTLIDDLKNQDNSYRKYLYKKHPYKRYKYYENDSSENRIKNIFGRKYSKHRNRGYKYHFPKSRKRNSSNSNSNSESNRRYRRKKTKKELREKKKVKRKKTKRISTVKDASEYAQRRCNDCIKLKGLLKKPLISGHKKGNQFIAELTKAENKCLQCNDLCQYLDKNMTKDMENYDIYEARYPSICLNDEFGNKRVFRLSNSYRQKLLQQIEHFDLNLNN